MKSLHLALSLALLPTTVLPAQPTIGAGFFCSFAADREGVVYGWGSNSLGQLGITSGDRKIPTFVMSGISSISTYGATLFLDTEGNVHATGYGQSGELGAGQQDPYLTTPRIVLGDVKAIATGNAHSLFLKTDGTVWACGSDRYGQLGKTESHGNEFTPVKVMNDVQAIAAGSTHSLFLKNDGSVWGSGFNGSGELAVEGYNRRKSRIHIMNHVKAIAAGDTHSLFLKTDGSVRAAGANYYGQLGSTSHIYTGSLRVMDGVKAIAAGNSISFFIKTDGTLWATGGNYQGQLGDGTEDNRYKPVQVLTGVAEVSSGMFHTIARKKDGTVWSTGFNDHGQLGDGTLTDRNRFAPVPRFNRPAGPEINIHQPAGTPLKDGKSGTTFGIVTTGKKAAPRTYVIRNTGTRPLTGLAIRTGGKHDKDFITTPPATTTLRPGETTTFKVTFQPSKTGPRTADIQIRSNDADESPFDIQLTGTGTLR